MKKLLFLPFACALFFLSSCTKDFAKVEVTYNKATAIYGDLDELRSMPLVGTTKEIKNPGKIFVGENVILVGEEEEGIHWIDNTNPESPDTKFFLNIPGNREFYVEGNSLYAESYYDMLKIDISNANQPQLLARIENAFAEDIVNDKGETLIGFHFETITEQLEEDSPIARQIWGPQEFYYFDYINNLIPPSAVPASFAGNSNNGIGTVNRIAYNDEHVYVLGNSNLYTFSDKGNFEFLASNVMGWQMETIYPHGEQVFIGTRNSMMIIDVTDPAAPLHRSSFWHATSCDPVFPVDDVAYVTLRTGDFSNCPGDINAIVVLDITNLNNPVEVQEVEMESPYGMAKFGGKLYVGEGANGLKIFDASNPQSLVLETWDKSIQAYDVIQHPTRTDRVLIAGPEGLGQYEIDGSDNLGLLSWLSY